MTPVLLVECQLRPWEIGELTLADILDYLHGLGRRREREMRLLAKQLAYTVNVHLRRPVPERIFYLELMGKLISYRTRGGGGGGMAAWDQAATTAVEG